MTSDARPLDAASRLPGTRFRAAKLIENVPTDYSSRWGFATPCHVIADGWLICNFRFIV